MIRLNFTRTKKWLKRFTIASAIGFVLALIVFIAAWFLFPFPVDKLEALPRSPIVTDRHGTVMLDLVGHDDQWRIPVALDDMSPWLTRATIAVEDERFRSHLGVDAIAVARALGQNVSSGRVVSGASTITMQVCRMLNDRPRTLKAKVIESFRALQLEQIRTKDEILATYLNFAPYGGNLRGVEAASLAYFGKPSLHLSLGEAALLAGLPQSPERFRPDRFPEKAGARRDTVLRRMVEADLITQSQADEASAQPLVIQRRVRERNVTAMQAAWAALQQRPKGGRTTIDLRLQNNVASLAASHIKRFPEKTNAAVVVIDIPTGEILAMVGSVRSDDATDGQVNGALAWRSPGSALKPFVYAAAMDAGRLNRDTMLYDGPIERSGWSPGNFDGTFAGEVRAADALQQSLNVPAILVAEGTGLHRCVGVMRAAGVQLPSDATSRGGLAVVVGSVETNLLSLTNAYATLGRGGQFLSTRLFHRTPETETETGTNLRHERVLRADTCVALDAMLSSHARRPQSMVQRRADDVPWFAWKTGTSSGRRDAWAVGHNGRVAIGVWIGRFDGSGNVAYVGAEAAEPLLARLFDEPDWRRLESPPIAAPLMVRRPLPLPREQSAALRITSPSNGSTFVAIEQMVPIRLASNRTGVTWFLNGKRLDSAPCDELQNQLSIDVLPGRYRLTCTDATGDSAVVRFNVK